MVFIGFDLLILQVSLWISQEGSILSVYEAMSMSRRLSTWVDTVYALRKSGA